ncbi:hypothetical protein ACJX0J_018125, partial [Zea mays]
ASIMFLILERTLQKFQLLILFFGNYVASLGDSFLIIIYQTLAARVFFEGCIILWKLNHFTQQYATFLRKSG